jgi:hypothetical protein
LDWAGAHKKKLKKLEKLVTNAHQLGMKPEDMAEMVDELWGVSRARNKIAQKKKRIVNSFQGRKMFHKQ